MNNKTNQPTTKKKSPLKKRARAPKVNKPNFFERYQFNNYFRQHIDEKFIDALIDEIIEWAHNPKTMVLKEFWIQKGIVRPRFYEWLDKYPQLKEAWDFAREIIGLRRENTQLDNPSIIRQSLPFYCDDWKQIDSYNDERTIRTKHKDEQGSVTINVLRDDFTKNEDSSDKTG